MTLALCLALVLAADPPNDAPKETPAVLRGEWTVTSTTAPKAGFLCSVPLVIGTDSAAWDKHLGSLQEKKGKGKLVGAGKEEGTLEWHVGDQVYQCLYRVELSDDKKEKLLTVLFGPAGGAAPKALPKLVTLDTFPKDASCVVRAKRDVKK